MTRTSFRAAAGAEKSDLIDRFGSILSGLDERVAQSLLNFERVWNSASKGRSRYSNGSFPVLYTAASESVAFVEKGHWVTEIILKPIGMSITLPPYYLFQVKVEGTFDQYEIDNDLRIVHPTDYSFCNELGEKAVRDGRAYLVVPSARVNGGVCVPVFRRDLSSVDEVSVDTFEYIWDADASKLSVAWAGSVVPADVDDVYSKVAGR